MNVKHLGPNKTEVGTSKATVLFSYDTPVAAFILGRGYVRTDKFWSVTTSKHINQWLKDAIGHRDLTVETISQEELDNLI